MLTYTHTHLQISIYIQIWGFFGKLFFVLQNGVILCTLLCILLFSLHNILEVSDVTWIDLPHYL